MFGEFEEHDLDPVDTADSLVEQLAQLAETIQTIAARIEALKAAKRQGARKSGDGSGDAYLRGVVARAGKYHNLDDAGKRRAAEAMLCGRPW